MVAAHELFGEVERGMPGNEHLLEDWVAIEIENEIREFHGLPLRSGKDHGYLQEEVTVTATAPGSPSHEAEEPEDDR
jgi:hypothetical protein